MKKKISGLVIGTFMISIVAFQNCGLNSASFSSNLTSNSNMTNGTNSTPTPVPTATATPPTQPVGLLSNCLNETRADACVFLKNPVSQDAAPVPSSTPWYETLTSRQRYAVVISGMDTSGYLQNDTITINGPGPNAGTTQRLTRNSSSAWKVAVNSETTAANKGNAATQVSAYYWLNAVIQALKSAPLIGSTYIGSTRISINPYAQTVDGATWQNAAYYYGGTYNDNIIIGYGLMNMPLAFSADVIIHEFTHALVQKGSNGQAGQITTATHRLCLDTVTSLSQAEQQSGGVCCKTEAGCVKAMNEGIADYFASIIFANDPAIGPGFTNTLNGLATCQPGTPYRNVLNNSNLTPNSVFNICTRRIQFSSGQTQTVTATGEIYTMGTVYTSILWQTRSAFQQALPTIQLSGGRSVTGGDLFDAIVYDHIMSWNSTSTFSTSRVALKSSATAVVSRFSLTIPPTVNLAQIIDNTFSARGVN